MNNQSIKDFNVGEKAYVVYANIGYNSPPRMKEVIITKVGRKYVTVKDLESYSSEYCYDDGSKENGYRFIWITPEGHLQPARGQARIPSTSDILNLVSKSIKEGWGHPNWDK